MRVEDCYLLGEVIKTHGLQGEVTLHLDVDAPQEYAEMESVFLESHGKLIPFFFEKLQITNRGAIAKFEEINSIDQAADLVKRKLYLPLSLLPELPDGKYYFHDLVGCIVTETGNELGEVVSVYELGPNNLMVVKGPQEQEVFVPINDEIVKKVSVSDKRIEVNLPDGLLELYQSET